MRSITNDISESALLSVCYRMQKAYPPVFTDALHNEAKTVIGNGVSSYLNRLKNRINYLSRVEEPNNLLNRNIRQNKAHNHAMRSVKAGCSEWSPIDLPEDQSADAHI